MASHPHDFARQRAESEAAFDDLIAKHKLPDGWGL